MATLTEMKKDVLRQPGNIIAILQRIACDYRDSVAVAIENVDAALVKNLTELVEEVGFKAVDDAVEAIKDDDLRINEKPYISLSETLNCVFERERMHNRQPKLAKRQLSSK